MGSRSMYSVLIPWSGSPFALRSSAWASWHLKYSEKYEGALGFSAGILNAVELGPKNICEITGHKLQTEYLQVTIWGSYHSMAQCPMNMITSSMNSKATFDVSIHPSPSSIHSPLQTKNPERDKTEQK